MDSGKDTNGSASNDGGPFRRLDTSDRRLAAIAYFVAAIAGATLAVVTGIAGLWLTAFLPLGAVGMYQVAAGRAMVVPDREAIRVGSDAAPFDVGHASATLGFSGLLARPVWQVLAFESGQTPGHQALITIDALSGEVTGSFSESVETP